MTAGRRTTSAGGVVVNRRGQVLVVNQRGNSWSLPKGHVDPGETKEAAARREIYEESGLTQLELLGELGSYERARIGQHGGEDLSELKSLHFFLFRTEQEKLSPVDPHHPEARWLEPDDVVRWLTHPRDQAFFLSVLPRVSRLGSPRTGPH